MDGDLFEIWKLLDGDTWFVGFITHRSVQSVFFNNGFKIDMSWTITMIGDFA